MHERERRERAGRSTASRSGLGTACFEAQADGVPCPDLGSRCGDCERSRGKVVRDPPRVAPRSERGPDHA